MRSIKATCINTLYTQYLKGTLGATYLSARLSTIKGIYRLAPGITARRLNGKCWKRMKGRVQLLETQL